MNTVHLKIVWLLFSDWLLLFSCSAMSDDRPEQRAWDWDHSGVCDGWEPLSMFFQFHPFFLSTSALCASVLSHFSLFPLSLSNPISLSLIVFHVLFCLPFSLCLLLTGCSLQMVTHPWLWRKAYISPSFLSTPFLNPPLPPPFLPPLREEHTSIL